MYAAAGQALHKILKSAAAKRLASEGIQEAAKRSGEALIEANERSKQAGQGNLAVRGVKWFLENGRSAKMRREWRDTK